MSDAPPPSMRLEIKRRLRGVYKSSLYFLIPFALRTPIAPPPEEDP